MSSSKRELEMREDREKGEGKKYGVLKKKGEGEKCLIFCKGKTKKKKTRSNQKA